MRRYVSQSNSRGFSTVLFLVILLTLFLFLFAGMEIGGLYLVAGKARNTAQATAIAAASRIPYGLNDSLDAALLMAGEHNGPNGPISIVSAGDNAPGSDLLFGRWDPETSTFEPTLVNPDAVKTTIRFGNDHPNGSVGFFFNTIFPDQVFNIERHAIAQLRLPPIEPRLQVTTPFENFAINMDGQSVIDVPEAVINVASTGIEAVILRDTASIRGKFLTVGGDVSYGSEAGIDCPLLTFAEPQEDPLRDLLPSDANTTPLWPNPDLSGNPAVLLPGTYPNGITAKSGNIQLVKGNYHLGSHGIDLRGNAQIMGMESVLIMTDPTSSILLDEDARITLEHPSLEDDTLHVSIYALNGPNAWSIRLNGELQVSGSIRAPEVTLQMQRGSLQAQAAAFKKIMMQHSSAIQITGNGLPEGATMPRGRSVLVQ